MSIPRFCKPIYKLLLASLAGLLLPGCNSKVPRDLQYGHNAMWCQSTFLRGFNPTTKERLSLSMVDSFGHAMERHQIKYAYLFAGPFLNDGHLPEYPFSDSAANTIKELKRINPGLIVLPWIGGIQNKTVHLQDPVWVKNAISDSERLIERLNVPGVHLDFEYILAGDPYLDLFMSDHSDANKAGYTGLVNDFCRQFKTRLPHAFISTVVLATAPDSKPWKLKTPVKDLHELTKYVDQLDFLFFDTGISDSKLFQHNSDALVRDIASLRSQNKIQYLIALGTFVNEPQLHHYRDMTIENITNSISVIKKSINSSSPQKQPIDGIALYCDWKTTDAEWQEFDKYWLNTDR